MKSELKHILVPVDFQEPSAQALRYAKNMATMIGAKIILLHVINIPGLLSDLFASSKELVQLTDLARNKMQTVIGQIFNEKENTITSRVEKGKPYEVITKIASENNCRMIIMGENHQGTDANQNLGSTVYHVTLKSPVPVLTIKGNAESLNNKIVVPLDLTTKMRRQLYSALAYGLNYNAEIHLVSALIGGIKMRESRIYKKLNMAKKWFTENGINCSAKLFPRSDEPPFRKVIKYADEVNAGMILVMTHKEGYTYDNYIGAFAHHIINKSKVPVLSLTASATNVDFGSYFNSIIDPAGLLLT